MSKMLLGQLVDDATYAGWQRLSNADKLSVVHANQAVLEANAAAAKRASLPPKPSNWDRGSNMDHRAWYLQQEREREGK